MKKLSTLLPHSLHTYIFITFSIFIINFENYNNLVKCLKPDPRNIKYTKLIELPYIFKHGTATIAI